MATKRSESSVREKFSKNISSVLAQADGIDWSEGLKAYHSYHQTMSGLADYYGYPLASVAAVFAALSPNNDYVKNLRSTATLLKGHKLGMSVETLTVSTYSACKRRAWRALSGEDFLSFTKGPKTRNFYQLIVNPEHPSAITIDGHMVSVRLGRRLTMVAAKLTNFKYEEVALDFRSVAFSQFIRPSQLQAVLWFTWKRTKNIVYDGNQNLFDGSDFWKMRWQPEDIKPFYI